ncbi:hypothetical protein NN3_00280 [Nocardia neocaledoniensis NBRC 108232]|nr:hypothetical protein NN3_00280 [Nocardia neocaledoniensis NBRC 108232]
MTRFRLPHSSLDDTLGTDTIRVVASGQQSGQKPTAIPTPEANNSLSRYQLLPKIHILCVGKEFVQPYRITKYSNRTNRVPPVDLTHPSARFRLTDGDHHQPGRLD